MELFKQTLKLDKERCCCWPVLQCWHAAHSPKSRVHCCCTTMQNFEPPALDAVHCSKLNSCQAALHQQDRSCSSATLRQVQCQQYRTRVTDTKATAGEILTPKATPRTSSSANNTWSTKQHNRNIEVYIMYTQRVMDCSRSSSLATMPSVHTRGHNSSKDTVS